MKITLRKKKLTTGKYSLYIEYYKGSIQNDQGKTEHIRHFETGDKKILSSGEK